MAGLKVSKFNSDDDDGKLTDFERRIDQRKLEKESIARQILKAELVRPGDKVFIGLGTTCYYIADAFMKAFEEIYIVTHSVAIVRRFRELWSTGQLKSSRVRVEITGGVVDPVMAYVRGGRARPEVGDKLIIAPHGINAISMGGFDAAPDLQRLLKQHTEIIVAATFEKFGRKFQTAIRKWGQCTSHGEKRWTFVYPDVSFDESQPGEVIDRTAIETTLSRIQTEGLDFLPVNSSFLSQKK